MSDASFVRVQRRMGLFADPSDRFINAYSGLLGLIRLSNAKRNIYPPITSLASSLVQPKTDRAAVVAHWKTITTAE